MRARAYVGMYGYYIFKYYAGAVCAYTRGHMCLCTCVHACRTEQNRTLYFDREVSVHIYIHIQNSYASSNRTLCIN